MVDKLNVLLSDFVVEYHKLQNLHWYVKGHTFFTSHTKLEDLYDEINEGIDEIGELILQIGGKPLGSLKKFLDTTTIKELEDEYKGGEEVFNIVLADFEHLLGEIKDVKKAAGEEDNALIDSAMDDFIAQFSKNIWMIRQRQM